MKKEPVPNHQPIRNHQKSTRNPQLQCSKWRSALALAILSITFGCALGILFVISLGSALGTLGPLLFTWQNSGLL